MNFYDVLAAKNWDGGIPTINFFDLLFAQSMGGAEQWETYEGTLPATLNANGDDMRQYQIYGITGGVGDRTENLFDYREYVYGYYISNSGVEIQSKPQPGFEEIRLNHSSYISVSPNESYTMKAHHQSMNAPQTVAIAWYDENKTFISRDFTQIPMKKNAGSYSFTATAPQNTKFAIFNFFTDDVQGIMFVKGTALPETYVPFGYKLDISTSDGTNVTTTPIYISNDPLGEDEYVDYGEQKIYRMIDGTLTPTDPPVALPALPTCEGETVVDYAGSGAAPEKVVFEYKKGGN